MQRVNGECKTMLYAPLFVKRLHDAFQLIEFVTQYAHVSLQPLDSTAVTSGETRDVLVLDSTHVDA